MKNFIVGLLTGVLGGFVTVTWIYASGMGTDGAKLMSRLDIKKERASAFKKGARAVAEGSQIREVLIPGEEPKRRMLNYEDNSIFDLDV